MVELLIIHWAGSLLTVNEVLWVGWIDSSVSNSGDKTVDIVGILIVWRSHVLVDSVETSGDKVNDSISIGSISIGSLLPDVVVMLDVAVDVGVPKCTYPR